MSWGWRVPFLLSVLLVGLGLYIQLRLEDTPAFRDLHNLKRQREHDSRRQGAHVGASAGPVGARAPARHSSPVMQALKTYPKQIVLAAGAFMAVQVTFYILIAFVVAYGTNPAGLNLPRDMMLHAALIGALVMIPAVFISAISDRLRNRVLNRELRPVDLDYQRMKVLAVLDERPGASMQEVADLTAVDRTSLTHTVQLLIGQGFVHRKGRANDRRSVVLKLTASGGGYAGLNRWISTRVARCFSQSITMWNSTFRLGKDACGRRRASHDPQAQLRERRERQAVAVRNDWSRTAARERSVG